MLAKFMRLKFTPRNIQRQLAELELSPASKTSDILRQVVSNARALGLSSVEIWIHVSLVGASYRSVPAMFARANSDALGDFNYKICILSPKKQFLIVKLNDQIVSATYRGLVLAALQETGKCVTLVTDVPPTYRFNPKPLAKSLTLRLDNPVEYRVYAGGRKIKWTFATDAN